jgi:hypothetical protein
VYIGKILNLNYASLLTLINGTRTQFRSLLKPRKIIFTGAVELYILSSSALTKIKRKKKIQALNFAGCPKKKKNDNNIKNPI